MNERAVWKGKVKTRERKEWMKIITITLWARIENKYDIFLFISSK